MNPLAPTLSLVAVLAATFTTPLVAQDADGPAETDASASASHLPSDSMEIGAEYAEWLIDYQADSLWARFSDEMRTTFGSIGDFKERLGELFRQIGTQDRVVRQRYWMRNGEPQFWHTAEFSGVQEPIVFRLVIQPDGTISGIGFNPESQNPPVDDPDQHGEADGRAVGGSDAEGA